VKLHIVCTGNTFRSRLAEAYINSKEIKGLHVSSSGTRASDNHSGPITWYCMKILKETELYKYMSTTWAQTTKEVLDDNDFIIFMEHSHLNWCRDNVGYKGDNNVVLNVADVFPDKQKTVFDDVMETEEIFSEIKYKIDKLIPEIEYINN
jgi:protein-tyrosine-phosphatase